MTTVCWASHVHPGIFLPGTNGSCFTLTLELSAGADFEEEFDLSDLDDMDLDDEPKDEL